jgi:hypothetical protein
MCAAIVPKLRLRPKLSGDVMNELPVVDSAPAGPPALPLAAKSSRAAVEISAPLMSTLNPDQVAPRSIKKPILIFAGVVWLGALSYGIYFVLLGKTRPLPPPLLVRQYHIYIVSYHVRTMELPRGIIVLVTFHYYNFSYAISVMHDEISNDQAQLLSTLNKQIIVVPDRDKTGLKMCDRALELGYQVSLPEWDTDIKDVNDAVVKYGKLPTLLSILHSATNSKIKIEMQRKKIAKGL